MASATWRLGNESADTRVTLNGVPFLDRSFVAGSETQPASSNALAAASASNGWSVAAEAENAQLAVGIGLGSGSARPASTWLTICCRSIASTSARRTFGSPTHGLPSPAEVTATNPLVQNVR